MLLTSFYPQGSKSGTGEELGSCASIYTQEVDKFAIQPLSIISMAMSAIRMGILGISSIIRALFSHTPQLLAIQGVGTVHRLGKTNY